MKAREFSIARRRRNLVDLLTPKRPNVKGYRLTAATNFDGTFETLLTADISSGYLDPAVDPTKLEVRPGAQNHIRIVFDPDTFTDTDAGISDSQHFWLKLVTVGFDGVPIDTSPAVLVITEDERRASNRIVIAGNAPIGEASANSLQLDLPFNATDIVIQNQEADAGDDLFVSTELGGPEHTVVPGSEISFRKGALSSLFVRGNPGAASFSASFVMAISTF